MKMQIKFYIDAKVSFGESNQNQTINQKNLEKSIRITNGQNSNTKPQPQTTNP